MQEQVTHTYRKDVGSRGHMVVPVAHKEDGYEKEKARKRDAITVTETIQQRFEGGKEPLLGGFEI